LPDADVAPPNTTTCRLQLLAKLKATVARLAGDVEGFKSSIDELRAAGRVEAMEDLMSGLARDLVRSVLYSLRA
jgi:hypothetical protein